MLFYINITISTITSFTFFTLNCLIFFMIFVMNNSTFTNYYLTKLGNMEYFFK